MSHAFPFSKTLRPIFTTQEEMEKALDYEVEENLDDFGVGGSAKKPADADSSEADSVVIEELCREIISIEPGGLLDQYS